MRGLTRPVSFGSIVRLLATWRRLAGSEDKPIEYTKLLNPVSADEQDAIDALGKVDFRLSDLRPQISRGFDEANDKKTGLIRWELCIPSKWSEVILKGAQITIATPFFKQPPETGVKGRPPSLTELPVDAIPRSEYARATDVEKFRSAQDEWMDYRQNVRRRYSDFYRLIWRRMIADNTDRSLFPALIPPGATWVHSVHGLILPDNRGTVLIAGFWSGLPMDYLLRITATSDLQTTNTLKLPAPSLEHPLAVPLLFRTLRLNCLTTAYADLWSELYDDAWHDETWTVLWPNIAPLSNVGPAWERDTPLRTEYQRRAALVEIDALVAVWLGITERQLESIYPARYPVLGDYEDVTWFDATGRKLAGNWNTFGTGQTKEHWEQFQAYLEDPLKNPPPDGYTAAVLQGRPDRGVPPGARRLHRAHEGGDVVRPTLAAEELKRNLTQYLTTTFALADQPAREGLERFLNDPRAGHVPRSVPADQDPVHARGRRTGGRSWSGRRTIRSRTCTRSRRGGG